VKIKFPNLSGERESYTLYVQAITSEFTIYCRYKLHSKSCIMTVVEAKVTSSVYDVEWLSGGHIALHVYDDSVSESRSTQNSLAIQPCCHRRLSSSVACTIFIRRRRSRCRATPSIHPRRTAGCVGRSLTHNNPTRTLPTAATRPSVRPSVRHMLGVSSAGDDGPNQIVSINATRAVPFFRHIIAVSAR